MRTIELAKALAWPVVVGGGLWYFRETIIANLPRVTRVGPVTLDPPPPQNLPVIADSTSNEAIKRVEALVPPELLAEARKLIEARVPRNAQGEKIAEVQYLTTLTATITLVALFEKAYGTIWGSQLQLLQSLIQVLSRLNVQKRSMSGPRKTPPQRTSTTRLNSGSDF
jgi:hypothetical protein